MSFLSLFHAAGTHVPEYKVIAGLGNPGERYARTRHNMGFLFADLVAERSVQGHTGKSAWREKFGGLVCDAAVEGQKLLLIKPTAFMNRSGQPIVEALQFYRIPPESLIVVHDDIDLPFGTVRLKKGGGDGGHNGIKSIAGFLGNRDFTRIRLGVGRPERGLSAGAGGSASTAPADEGASGERPDIAAWVLGRFSTQEQDGIPNFLSRGFEALQVLIKEGLSIAQTRFN